MSCDAQSLINSAYANGYAGLSERDLMECIVASACSSGGGGGGSGVLTCGTTVPTIPPASGCGIYVRKEGAQTALYAWDGSQWQPVVGT